MANPIRRGESGSQVSSWHTSSNAITPNQQTSFFLPHGLKLQQTITSSGSVTIPDGVTWVYAIMTSGGGGGYFNNGGNAGELVWGWTLALPTCIIGAGGTSGAGSNGGYTRYGHLIATGVGTRGSQNRPSNFYGQPAGITYGDSSFVLSGGVGANAGSGSNGNSGYIGGNGGNGISGGCGGGGQATTGTSTGGNGGSGIIGGGGGFGSGTTVNRTGGNGGSGIGIDGTVYTGGAGLVLTSSTNAPGGGGAGIAGNGSNASGINGGNGGLGGGGQGAGVGGSGGAGILYLFY